MISLLINTIRRYDNLEKILKAQLDYDCIDEIIVMNNGGQPISVKHDKLKVITPSWDVGLRSRWILGALAKNDCLCVQDDDLILDEEVFDLLYGHFMLDNDKTYGVFGRRVDILNSYKINEYFAGYVDIILTRIACFHKRLIPYLLEAENIVCKTRYLSASEWPADDILLSYTSLSAYSKKPFAVPVSPTLITELDGSGGLYQQDKYMEKRASIIAKCKQLLCYEELFDLITEV